MSDWQKRKHRYKKPMRCRLCKKGTRRYNAEQICPECVERPPSQPRPRKMRRLIESPERLARIKEFQERASLRLPLFK